MKRKWVSVLLALTTLVLTTVVVFLTAPVALAAARDIAVWNFEDLNTTVDIKDAGVSSATAGAGSGLTSETFPSGNGSTGGWSWVSWTTASSRDANDYFQFAIDLTNFGGITFSFDERRSGTGIRDWEVRYSVDGGSNFTTIDSGTVPDDTNWRSHPVPITSGGTDDLAMRGKSNVIFRVYGFNAEGGTGTWRLDNVRFYATTGPNALTLRAMDARTAGGGAALPLLALTLAGGVAAAGARVARRRR